MNKNIARVNRVNSFFVFLYAFCSAIIITLFTYSYISHSMMIFHVSAQYISWVFLLDIAIGIFHWFYLLPNFIRYLQEVSKEDVDYGNILDHM